jgi:thioredoxin reductase/NAD-dependent dihydropyrimidine dehydrogenase PreA subunit
MSLLLEQIAVYSVVAILCLGVVAIYLRKQQRESRITKEKIKKAKEDGLFEPVSLHPVINHNCIKSGACIAACPEHDILGIVNGRATVINASQCIGHGACFHACPTQAITLCIGTEKRGVDLPDVNQNFETNVPGIYIAGELGGMGLIRNAVEQGKQATDNIAKFINKNHEATYDLVVIGAGPAGISASLTAKKHQLKTIVLEQDTLGGTVFTFPRSKIVMTSPMDLPLYGKVKFFETSKTELLDLWHTVLTKNDIAIKEKSKVESIVRENEYFKISTLSGEQYTSKAVLLSIGRRGTPRKLNVPGEELEKVAYRLLDPENIVGKDILVVGGGDSAIESALLLADNNRVTLSYRSDVFSRLKPLNSSKINEAIANKHIDVRLNSNVLSIEKSEIILSVGKNNETFNLKNDLVYIFAGGELPTQFLEKVGISVTKKFGEAILKH